MAQLAVEWKKSSRHNKINLDNNHTDVVDECWRAQKRGECGINVNFSSLIYSKIYCCMQLVKSHVSLPATTVEFQVLHVNVFLSYVEAFKNFPFTYFSFFFHFSISHNILFPTPLSLHFTFIFFPSSSVIHLRLCMHMKNSVFSFFLPSSLCWMNSCVVSCSTFLIHHKIVYGFQCSCQSSYITDKFSREKRPWMAWRLCRQTRRLFRATLKAPRELFCVYFRS